MHRPFNVSKSNTKSKPVLQQVNVRTDMPREDPLLLSADLDAARDAPYLPVISVLFGNSHGNSRVASSGKASKKKKFKARTAA